MRNAIWEKSIHRRMMQRLWLRFMIIFLFTQRDSRLAIRNLLPRTESKRCRYKNPDNDPRGPWKSAIYTCGNLYERILCTRSPLHLESNDGPPERHGTGACSEDKFDRNRMRRSDLVGQNGNNTYQLLKHFLIEGRSRMVPHDYVDTS